MGLRCLVGHDYGEQQTSRDRRQQGSEVVVTVREYRECRRCGHRRVIAENKEVTAEPSEPSTEFPLDPSVTASFERPDGEAEAAASVDAGPTTPSAFEEPLTAEEDDGIILVDDPEPPARAYGEWPEAEAAADGADPAGDAEPQPWPLQADEPPTDADESSEVAGSVEAASSIAAEPADGVATSAPVEDDDDILVAGTPGAAEPASFDRPDDRATELVCPSCAETWPSVNVSLRPGDICPDCHRDYLDEQVIQ